MPSVAILGSFRRHYEQVLQAREIFQANGITVNTPLGNPVLDENALFVRFDEEFEGEDDPTVQSYALHRIMRADAVYVVLPGRYIGRTSSYEVGRIIQAERYVYFSEEPHDLPIRVPKEYVVGAEQLANIILGKNGKLGSLHAEGEDRCSILERRLLSRDLAQD